MNVWVLAFVAGACFAGWPLCMNKSGLNGFVAAAVFSTATFLGVVPLALKSNGFTMPTASWWAVVGAGAFGIVGLLSFTTILSRVSPRDLSPYLLIVGMVQVTINAIHHAYHNQGMPADKICACIAACVVTYVLAR